MLFPFLALVFLVASFGTHVPIYKTQIKNQYEAIMAVSARQQVKNAEELRKEKRVFIDSNTTIRLERLSIAAKTLTSYMLGINNYTVFGLNEHPHNFIIEILLNFGIFLVHSFSFTSLEPCF